MKIDEKTKQRLKKILVDIACADANEVIRWGKEQIISGKGEIRLSKRLSRAVSSIKMKASDSGIDVDLKLLDRLKAIELYFKLCGVGESEGAEGIYVSYDYLGTDKGDGDDE